MALLTQFWGLDILICAFSLVLCVYLYAVRNFNYWKRRGFKEIPPTAVFGNFTECFLARKPLVNVLNDIYEYEKNEPSVGFYVLDKPYLLLRDPELIKHVLIKDFANFTGRVADSYKTDDVGKFNLFVLRNPDWKYIRQKISPIFTSGRLKKMLDLMLEIDKDLDQYMKTTVGEGKIVKLEVKDICAKFTTDVIGITAYGMRFNALSDENSYIRKVGKTIFKKSYKRHLEFLSTLLVPSIVDFFGFHLLGKASSQFLSDLFYRAMKERLDSGTKRADLIDFLIDLKKEQENGLAKSERKIHDGQLIAQAAIFFTGGFETSSTTMSFALYELANNPDVQQKLREELLDVLEMNNGKVTYDMLMNSLPYLEMVISETLRMYPILPYLDRKPEKNYQCPITKLVIPAGTPIVVPMRSIHMDSKYFPHPEQFDPSRFSEENKINITPNTYFPFGDGPRICVGMRLGMIQTKLGLIRLISNYEFSPCPETLRVMQFDNMSAFLSSAADIVLNVKRISTR
ncbi:cytochrome P450 6k1-like [Trichogramma pretiosum]|uniref:cytochrome P450 6k1-like n=1 Tax=Trichogramma pretiosum TaxID=7493 RepID=UPI0006C9C41A|nr:cytochrome P450 6k1-like [Trichogramma pretiosum]